MLTTEAMITSIDLNSNVYSVRVPLFENLNIGSQAIMNARVAVQPGSFNNYKIGDVVWVTFINGSTETALIIGKIYKGPDDEIKNSGGSLSVESLKVANGTALLPANTLFNIGMEDFNSIDKLINKIKNLEVQNTLLVDQIINLQHKINELAKLLGEDLVRDVDGNILTDSNNETLQYAKKEN